MTKSTQHPRNESGVHARMRDLMAAIQQEYDFTTFTWSGFVRWLARRRGKQVHLIPLPMGSATLFGSWISSDTEDFIFFDQDALPMHQIHIQLHEIAHILCDHTTYHVDIDHLPRSRAELMRLVEGAVRLRHVAEGETEQEAEILTALIQSCVFRHGRQAALTRFDFQNHDEEVLINMMELG